MSLYQVLDLSLVLLFPINVANLAECKVSLNRIQKYLELSEITGESVKPESKKCAEQNIALSVSNVSAHWTMANENIRATNALANISLTVKSSQICGIIGAVGSGKSTLLHAILGELPISAGKIEIHGGRLGYSAQKAWIFPATVRQNVIFNHRFDEKRYRKVIQVTALDKDINIWKDGDQTFVGDRGIILSGGQMARVNLARCIYSEADIYLLDDPLSAVDVNVGRHLYESCIRGFLKDKAVILVTHQVHYLKDVDEIVVMKNGLIDSRGSFAQLMNSNKVSINGISESKVQSSKSEEKVVKPNIKVTLKKVVKEVKHIPTRKLYYDYVSSGGKSYTWPLLILLPIITQSLFTITDIFFGFMVTQSVIGSSYRLTDLLIFAGLTIGIFIFSIFRILLHFVTCLNSSEAVHNKMFIKILHTPARFFDTNPSGQILNRFSKDMAQVDELLPQYAYEVSLTLGISVGSFITAMYYQPILIPPVIVILVIFYYIRQYYLASARPLKRMEGMTKAPIFTQLSSTLDGLITIRACQARDKLISDFDQKQDVHTSTYYAFQTSGRWVGLCLDFVAITFVILCVLAFLIPQGPSSVGDIGVVLTTGILLIGKFQYGIKQSAELETAMTSVERILEYGNMKGEEEEDILKCSPPSDWPKSGKIQFHRVTLTYGKEGETNKALKNVTFDVKNGEKIGIVGRTGAGKSSLIAALLRLAKAQGSILIDNFDISVLSMEVLRKHISIIPQDPLLFAGTLRKNLDPFDEYEDDEIWKALKQVQLHKAFFTDGKGEETFPLDLVKVNEEGSNFSVGQRQLVCLARAILRNNRILVMDEATANVDPKTDDLIQRTIRERFTNCTILTVAHRLHTILDSDRILVLNDGEVEEIDTLEKLMTKPQGGFRNFIDSMDSIDREDLFHNMNF